MISGVRGPGPLKACAFHNQSCVSLAQAFDPSCCVKSHVWTLTILGLQRTCALAHITASIAGMTADNFKKYRDISAGYCSQPVAPCWVPLPVSCRLTVCASTHISCISNFHSYMAYHSPKAAGENRDIFSILHVLAATKNLLLIPLNLLKPPLFPYYPVCWFAIYWWGLHSAATYINKIMLSLGVGACNIQVIRYVPAVRGLYPRTYCQSIGLSSWTVHPSL